MGYILVDIFSKYRQSLIYIYQNADDFCYTFRWRKPSTLSINPILKDATDRTSQIELCNKLTISITCSCFVVYYSFIYFVCMCVCVVSFVFFISLAKLSVIHLNWSMTRYLSFELHHFARIKFQHSSNGCNTVKVGGARLKWSPLIGFNDGYQNTMV